MRVLGKIRPTVLDVFLVFAFFASTGMIWESTRPKGRPLSGLHVVPEQVELGEVDQVEGVPFDCRLENLRGPEAIITEVTLPCTCTTLDLTTQTSLSPGESVRIHGNVDARNRRGACAITIPLTYRIQGSVQKYVALIRIRMYVKPSIASSQDMIVLREDSWAPLVLSGGSAQSFRISAIEPSDPYIRWESIGLALGETCSEFRLRFTLDRSLVHDPTSLSRTAHWVKFVTSASGEPTFQLPVAFEISEKKAP
jgi:Protein of unknown function (DUF1573)